MYGTDPTVKFPGEITLDMQYIAIVHRLVAIQLSLVDQIHDYGGNLFQSNSIILASRGITLIGT